MAFLSLVLPAGAAEFQFVDDAQKGQLTIRDGGVNVLTYCYGDQLPEGLSREYLRACYIHPLYSLDGKPLTADFPRDHYHQHGVSWVWPRMKTRGRDVQTWHPSAMRQHFSRWLEQSDDVDAALLRLENELRMQDGEVVGRETLTLRVHGATERGRAIDLELAMEAVGGPLEVAGTADEGKGYGGFYLRGAAEFLGRPVASDAGRITEDKLHMPLRWADMSTAEHGAAVFVPESHPDFPPEWMIRLSYGDFLNVAWPGLKIVTIEPGKPLTLRYRLYVHRGDAEAGQVAEAYRAYAAEQVGP